MRKKILYIHHGKGLGGAPLSLLYLIEALDKTKFHPIVLFLHNSEVVDLYKSKGIDVAGIVNLMDFSHTKIYWYRWYHIKYFLKASIDTIKTLFYAADYWLNKIKPDLIHLNTSSLIAWAKVANQKKIPIVFHVREPLARGYFGLRKKLVINCVKKYAKKITPICKNDAKPWEESSKVQVVYNAVDKNKFDKDMDNRSFDRLRMSEENVIKKEKKHYDISSVHPELVEGSKDSLNIFFLGGLSKEKGTLEIFEIFEKLLKISPNAKLIVAGYFNLKNKSKYGLKNFFPTEVYKAKINKVLDRIKKSVIFTGPQKNIEQLFFTSNVVVVPSIVGHFARPIIEAGFMQKTVVANNIKPLDELVLNDKTGFLIDIENKDAWVQKLYDLLTNKNFNKEVGKSAYEFCRKNFDVIDQAKKIENIYENIL